MQLIVETTGAVRCIYAETLDLHALGQPAIRRASHVETNQHGRWVADLGPVGGPRLGPFICRSEALQAESDWLESHWLTSSFKSRAI